LGALPATGALLITAIVVVWLTSALWLFSDPVSTGVAVDSAGNIYVADSTKHQVLKLPAG
jgi:hypothetical protein